MKIDGKHQRRYKAEKKAVGRILAAHDHKIDDLTDADDMTRALVYALAKKLGISREALDEAARTEYVSLITSKISRNQVEQIEAA